MELLKGCTLREELQRLGCLPVARARHILQGVCLAVEAAHQREMIHRDLKPENVFLCQSDVLKVLDFGLAKALETGMYATLTETGYVVGTLPYMAPERLRGDEVSPDWDLWALAVMSVEMIAGTRPFGDRPGGSAATEWLTAQPEAVLWSCAVTEPAGAADERT